MVWDATPALWAAKLANRAKNLDTNADKYRLWKEALAWKEALL